MKAADNKNIWLYNDGLPNVKVVIVHSNLQQMSGGWPWLYISYTMVLPAYSQFQFKVNAESNHSWNWLYVHIFKHSNEGKREWFITSTSGDDWGMVYYCFTHIIQVPVTKWVENDSWFTEFQDGDVP